MKISWMQVAIAVVIAAPLSIWFWSQDQYYFWTDAGAFVAPIRDTNQNFTMPAEDDPHEATWLQWPHDYGWDPDHIVRYEEIWVGMTESLAESEKVNIIVFDDMELERVTKVLEERGVQMDMIEFFVMESDDVWIRDNGPIFVRNQKGNLVIQNWRFNGWGNKADYWADNCIPEKIGEQLGMQVENVPMVSEGGSIELDGRGTLMAKKSSILISNRNPGWTLSDIESYYRHYLGVTNFIWLPGKKGADITDDHIDGTARFANGDTIVTTLKKDMWNPSEYEILRRATDAEGNPYKLVYLPVTTRKVEGVDYPGTYVNYYVGNSVVIVPAFDDPNDEDAASILQSLYPEKKVVSINMIELYKDGGLVHCVTQQQPKQ